jgi:putative Mg2+ transporter-C (MgtC) family protein
MIQMLEGVNLELRMLAGAAIALLLGGIIGWEREHAGKWAGLRTHMLVCLAAFMFVKTGELLIIDAQKRYSSEMLRADPVRILEAIMTGLAFIGAGTIFRDKDKNVARGLTTAASLLCVAPLGVAVAIERYILAAGATLIILFVLRGLLWLEAKYPLNGLQEKN